MVCFLIVTATLSLARYDLQFATGGNNDRQSYFVARGQVQELVALLENGDVSLQDYPRETPWSETVNGLEVKAWVEQDPARPEVYHVFAQAGEQRSESALVVGPKNEASVFRSLYKDIPNAIEQGGGPQSFFMQTGTGTWTELPPQPDYVYSGSLSSPTRTQREYVSPGYSADAKGHLFVSNNSLSARSTSIFRYDPTSQTWGDLGPVPGVVVSANGVPALSSEAIKSSVVFTPTGSGQELYVRPNSSEPLEPGESASVLRKLDTESGQWSLIRGPQDRRLSLIEGGPDKGLVASPTGPNMSPTNEVVVLDGSDWNSLPNAPLVQIQDMAVGPNGEIYVYGDPDGSETSAAVAKYDPDTRQWSSVSIPPGAQVRCHGKRISVDSDGSLVCLKNNQLYGISYARLEDGVWTDVPPLPPSGEPDLIPWSVLGSGGGGADQMGYEEVLSR